MDVLEKLRELLNERGWSEYRLAQKAGLNESTISNIYRRNTVPTIATLKAVCDAFGITLSQFFADSDSDMVELTPELKELLDACQPLTPEQRAAILQVANHTATSKRTGYGVLLHAQFFAVHSTCTICSQSRTKRSSIILLSW